MSEWQPIETAPKDGTPILAYWHVYIDGDRIHNASSYAIARWDAEQAEWVNAEDDDDLYGEPTDWQPLPDPPK